MELLLVLLAGCLAVYAASLVVKVLKKHWKTVLCWVAVILAAFIGIKLLPLFGTGWKIITIFIIIICFAALIASAIYYWMGYGSYPSWLERVGIGELKNAPGTQRAHNWAVERGYVAAIEGYVLSTKFRDKILDRVEQRDVWRQPEFQKCCRSLASRFRAEYTEVLLNYLADENYLLEVGLEGPYLSQKMVSACEHLLDHEGAATETEFAEICGKSDVASCLYEERSQLAKAILTNMVHSGKADKVAHNAGVSGSDGGDLYVSKNPAANCRMTKREISLDD